MVLNYCRSPRVSCKGNNVMFESCIYLWKRSYSVRIDGGSGTTSSHSLSWFWWLICMAQCYHYDFGVYIIWKQIILSSLFHNQKIFLFLQSGYWHSLSNWADLKSVSKSMLSLGIYFPFSFLDLVWYFIKLKEGWLGESKKTGGTFFFPIELNESQMKEQWNVMAHRGLLAQLQWGVNHPATSHPQGRANAILFHHKTKAGSCLWQQLVGDSLVPMLSVKEKKIWVAFSPTYPLLLCASLVFSCCCQRKGS